MFHQRRSLAGYCDWSCTRVRTTCASGTAPWLGSFTTPTISPKVDWPMVHGAENKIAIRSADALRDIARSPILLRASRARPVVTGKYKRVRKKVVSHFIKELIACMDFLNRRLESRRCRGHSKCLLFLRHTWRPL